VNRADLFLLPAGSQRICCSPGLGSPAATLFLAEPPPKLLVRQLLDGVGRSAVVRVPQTYGPGTLTSMVENFRTVNIRGSANVSKTRVIALLLGHPKLDLPEKMGITPTCIHYPGGIHYPG